MYNPPKSYILGGVKKKKQSLARVLIFQTFGLEVIMENFYM